MKKIDKKTQYRYNNTNADNVFLRHKEKYYLGEDTLVEITFFEVKNDINYPHGFKYRCIAINLKTNERILMDNHHPKGDHIHINEKEFHYNLTSAENLFEDFQILIKTHLGDKI